MDKLDETKWIYVDNFPYKTETDTLYDYFGRIGTVNNVVRGKSAIMDKMDTNDNNSNNDNNGNNGKFKQLGFAFVEFLDNETAKAAVNCLNGSWINDRKITVHLDLGYTQGRELARGKTGYQKFEEKQHRINKHKRELLKKFKDKNKNKNKNNKQNKENKSNKNTNNEENKTDKNTKVKCSQTDSKTNINDEVTMKTVNESKESNKTIMEVKMEVKMEEKTEEKTAGKKKTENDRNEYDIVMPRKKKRRLNPEIQRKLNREVCVYIFIFNQY